MESTMRYINRIARLAQLQRDRQMEKLGLSGIHHTYILNICRQPGLTQEQLAKTIFVNKSNVARQLAFLEKSGFITRQPNPQDARKLEIFPTEQGLAAVAPIAALLSEWNQVILEGIPEARRAALLADLAVMMANAEATVYGGEAN